MSLKNRVKYFKKDIIKHLKLKHFTIKEMGDSWGDDDFNYIRLNSKFFDKHIRPCLSKLGYNDYIDKWNKPIETDIACPFCDKGIIRLTEKEKDIDTIHVQHIGNNYDLTCLTCHSMFTYHNRWGYL